MVQEFNVHQDPPEFRKQNLDIDNYLNREHMVNDLYTDKDWMTQVGLGDVEFEMDAYDHFTKNNNQLALQGLREHNEYGGPPRYLDMTPFNIWGGKRPTPVPGDKNPLINTWEDFQEPGYMGMFVDEDFNKGPRRIDINLPDLMDMNEQSRIGMRGRVPHEIDEGGIWSLRNLIFDLYGHEYGHGIKRLNEFKNIGFEHPTIYYNEAEHGVHPGNKAISKGRFETWPRRFPEQSFGNTAEPIEDSSDFLKDYLNRPREDIVKDIMDEVLMYQGRSKMDENLRQLPWQWQPNTAPGPWNEFSPNLGEEALRLDLGL